MTEETEVAPVQEEGQAEAAVTPVAETSPQTDDTQGGDKHLDGGNWYDASNYKGVPAEAMEQFQQTLKEVQGNSDRVINEKLDAGRKNYSFNDANELRLCWKPTRIWRTKFNRLEKLNKIPQKQ